MTNTHSSGLRLSLKVTLITLGSLAALVAVLFILRSALGLYAYRAQGFPLPVKDFMSTDSISVPGFFWSPSTDTTPVLITLNDTTKLRIPRNYLFDAAIVNPFPSMKIRIVTTYPAFKGIVAATMDKSDLRNMYADDNVVIIERIPDMDAEAVRRNQRHWLDKMRAANGSHESNPHEVVASWIDYAMFKTPEDSGVIIRCPRSTAKEPEGTVNMSFCDVTAGVASNFVVHYQFRPSLLAHWREIDDGVMNLLNSFVEK